MILGDGHCRVSLSISVRDTISVTTTRGGGMLVSGMLVLNTSLVREDRMSDKESDSP